MVKICGITRLEDAQIAAESGADAIGFIFFEKSARYILPEAAASISEKLPLHLARVGVFVNPSEQQVLQAISSCGLNILQFHGEEPPEFCTQFGLMSMKAFRVKDQESLQSMRNYHTDAWLLDSYNPKERGGTGETFDWSLAVQARQLGRPVVLAGGLKPENVAEAIQAVQPFGVDVSSGVEIAPGRKDPNRVREFISRAKTAAEKVAGPER
jgi:phosphoribosylanthranilate isomerase